MTNQNKNLPPHIQAMLDAHLKSEQPPAPRRDLHRDFAERLDYCRQFDQTKMPAWRDPRTPR
jgi:hypothetical protein